MKVVVLPFTKAIASERWIARSPRDSCDKANPQSGKRCACPTIRSSVLTHRATERSTDLPDAFHSCGLDRTSPMAGNDRDAPLGVAGRGAIENETPMGLLDFPAQQCAL